MKPHRNKLAIALTTTLILAMALIPTAASAWTAQAKNHSAMPRFTFNLHVGAEHTSVSDIQVHSPCVVQSGYRVVEMREAGPVVVGSQSGLHDNRTSSLSFHAEGAGLQFTLNTNLTPGWSGELIGRTTHVTLSNPGVCHEQVEIPMFIRIAPSGPIR